MKYMGSKNRIAKHIVPIILQSFEENNCEILIDCTVGGGNFLDKIPTNIKRYGVDINSYLIAMWDAVSKGWLPPEIITENDYNHIRLNKDEDPVMTGYVGFALTYGGKWFGGWSRGKNSKGEDRDYVDESRRNALKQFPIFKDVKFYNMDFMDIDPKHKTLLYCFDKETEVLTERGWLNVKEVNESDKCLSREPNTNKLDWVPVVGLVNYHYEGKMYQYKGKNIDLLVTPNHRLFVNKLKTRSKIPNDEFIEASSAFKSDFRFISAGGIWDGDNNNEIEICGDIFNKEDFAYILGIFITDGCINNQDNIFITQTKPQIREKIKEYLIKLKIDFTEHSKYFYLSRKYKNYFKQFYLKNNRKIPKEFKESNIKILSKLLEGIMDGDGSENRRIVVGSKSLVDDIQEITYKLGYSSNFQKMKPKKSFLKNEKRFIIGKEDYYTISINKKPYLSHFHKNETYVDYDDMVYCFEIEKWHSVLTRRNGKIIWCGQCDIPYKGTTKYKDDFNYEAFYDWCRDMKAKGNVVFVSEYEMPEDFKCVWQGEINSSLTKETGAKKGLEKLFTL